MPNLDQKTIRSSRARLVISGSKFELYSYEKPYLYNFPPLKRGEGGKKIVRARRADNLAVARRRIQRLISANMEAWGEMPKFVTYTFAENVTDISSANAEWLRYIRKARQAYGQLRYLTVVEFQLRGAVHYHTIFFNMPYRRGLKHHIAKQWGQGFVKVKALGKVNDIALYVSKYLTEDTSDERLAGKKAFFCSRGLHKPVEVRREANVDEWTSLHQHATLEDEHTRKYNSDRFGLIVLKTGIC